jgi:carotenoid 1,2-hydratase
VFSPYYASAFARRGAAVDPDNHCALNVALYGPSGQRWAMTERGRAQVQRERSTFNIGPSRLQWQHDHLRIDIDERCAPWPQRVCGSVRVYPQALSTFGAPLDDAGRHRWGPIAPSARVEVDLQRPGVSWRGEAYFDSNEGDEPVASGPFRAWDWSRARLRDGSTAVVYDVRQTNGNERVIAERFMPDGRAQAFEPPARHALPNTLWRIGRSMRSEGAEPPIVVRALEDTPFYARSLLSATLLGERVTAVHETLEPQRLAAWPVRLMLPWRMPRLAG